MKGHLDPLRVTHVSTGAATADPESRSFPRSSRMIERFRDAGRWCPFRAAMICTAVLSCSRGEERADTGGSTGGDTSASPVAVAPPPAPGTRIEAAPPPRPLSPARDADHHFLRHMLDHHERIILVAHEQMMEPAGHAAHGAGTDPGALDSRLDAEKLEMLALLRKLYAETYSPRAGVAEADAHDTGAGEEGPAVQARLATEFRAGVALVDRSLPGLTRPAVRDLARRVRASQAALANQMAADTLP